MSEVNGRDYEPFPKGAVILSSEVIVFDPNERRVLKKLFQFKKQACKKLFPVTNPSREGKCAFYVCYYYYWAFKNLGNGRCNMKIWNNELPQNQGKIKSKCVDNEPYIICAASLPFLPPYHAPGFRYIQIWALFKGDLSKEASTVL